MLDEFKKWLNATVEITPPKANGLEPYWYFRYLLEKLPDAMTEDDYKALLPQYLDKTKLAGPPYIA